MRQTRLGVEVEAGRTSCCWVDDVIVSDVIQERGNKSHLYQAHRP